MLKKLLGALAVAVIVLIGVAYMLPSQVHVERTISIDRPAAAVFPLVNSFRRFNDWSPWKQQDPTATYTYSGPDAGVGAAMAWSGNSKVGRGTQVITESVPDSRVSIDLVFGNMTPQKAAWLLSADGLGTKVVWTLESDVGNSPLGRYLGLFLDKMVGPDYEQGLKQLKALAEKTTAEDAAQQTSSATTAANASTS
jgi:Polyketide cyclase / dehydrase and lipid transport